MSARLGHALEWAQDTAKALSGRRIGAVYVIGGDGGTVKVGLSRRPTARLRNIISNSGRAGLRIVYQTPVYLNGGDVETLAQDMLMGSHVAGEWFNATEDRARLAVMDAEAQLCDVGSHIGVQTKVV